MEFQEQLQKFLGSSRVEIEGTVEYSDVLDSMLMNDSQTLTYGFHGKSTYRLFASTYTEGASVEASTSGFQLYERFTPIEKFTFFGRYQLVEWQYSSEAIVLVLLVGIQITKSGNSRPFFRLVPNFQPTREFFFAFSSKHTIYKRIPTKERPA